MSPKITATHERVDDIPAIIAHLKKMRVAEGLDNHFPTNGNWEGLSLGWTTVVWLTFILSEGDHRLYRVESWVKEHPGTLRRCIDEKIWAMSTMPVFASSESRNALANTECSPPPASSTGSSPPDTSAVRARLCDSRA